MLEALETYVRPVIALEDECRALSAAGLNHTLPEGADPMDALARYMAAKISVEPF